MAPLVVGDAARCAGVAVHGAVDVVFIAFAGAVATDGRTVDGAVLSVLTRLASAVAAD